MANRGQASADQSSGNRGKRSAVESSDNRGGKQRPIWTLIAGLVAIIAFGVLMIGGIAGWFSDPKTTLDAEYYAEAVDYTDLTAVEYEELVAQKKSFIIFVDQAGCVTAEKLHANFTEYMVQNGVRAYHMMFDELKESSLRAAVKYYPSIVIVRGGRPVAWLRADADEDALAYNNYDDLVVWLDKYLNLK